MGFSLIQRGAVRERAMGGGGPACGPGKARAAGKGERAGTTAAPIHSRRRE